MHVPAWIFKVLFFAGLLLFQRLSTRRRRESATAPRSPELGMPTSTSVESIGGGVAITSKPLTPK